MKEKDEAMAQRDYYYQERETLAHEKSQIQEKYEAMDASKLEKKLKMLEEEKNVIKSDYVIKMESFVEEISTLKQRLAAYENSNSEESKSQPSH